MKVVNGEWDVTKNMTKTLITYLKKELLKRVTPSGKKAAKETTIGIPAYDNGVFEGALVDGDAHGTGKITYPNGRVHEGNFIKGKKNGEWKIIYPNGRVKKEHYVNGVKIWNLRRLETLLYGDRS